MTRKHKILQANGTLNLHPHSVTDPLFHTYHFFDAHDLVQVKYEMLRRVQLDAWSITQATKAFGFSRPAFYQAQAMFKKVGLIGLLPQKRGPKKAHKLSSDVLSFVLQQRDSDPQLSSSLLIKKIKKHFGINIHQRSIERALSRHQKK
jgi:transposase